MHASCEMGNSDHGLPHTSDEVNNRLLGRTLQELIRSACVPRSDVPRSDRGPPRQPPRSAPARGGLMVKLSQAGCERSCRRRSPQRIASVASPTAGMGCSRRFAVPAKQRRCVRHWAAADWRRLRARSGWARVPENSGIGCFHTGLISVRDILPERGPGRCHQCRQHKDIPLEMAPLRFLVRARRLGSNHHGAFKRWSLALRWPAFRSTRTPPPSPNPPADRHRRELPGLAPPPPFRRACLERRQAVRSHRRHDPG
jgi:hypothetical protein